MLKNDNKKIEELFENVNPINFTYTETNKYYNNSNDIDKDEKILLGTIDNIKIYSVSGHYTRTNISSDFTLGSHGLIEDYIPDDEIWIERMLNKIDEGINLSHEIIEYLLMKHKKINYDDAHKISIDAEDILRDIL